MTITTIGLDLAKSVFQAHGVDETGATTLTRAPPWILPTSSTRR